MIKQNRNVLSYFWKISVSASEITPIEFLRWCIVGLWASHMTLVIRNTPAGDTEVQVQSLGQEDPLRRKLQPTLVFLPGESHGRRSLAGYSPRGHKESDKTEVT